MRVRIETGVHHQMVSVAQSEERKFVELEVAGSKPVRHPNIRYWCLMVKHVELQPPRYGFESCITFNYEIGYGSQGGWALMTNHIHWHHSKSLGASSILAFRANFMEGFNINI